MKRREKSLRYSEPTIRSITGIFLTLCGVLAYFLSDLTIAWLSILLFVSISPLQSAFTRFCLIEKILRRIGFLISMTEKIYSQDLRMTETRSVMFQFIKSDVACLENR